MSKEKIPAKVTLRQRQKQETCRLILESARMLFETDGYTKTTIRRIADHAGIGLGTIYKHFDQKSDVLAATFYNDINGILESAIDSIPEDLNLKESLMMLAGAFYSFYGHNQKMARTYIKQIVFITGEGRKLNEQLDLKFLEYVASLVDKAKKTGEARSDVDSGLVAYTFFSNYLMTLGFFFFKESNFSIEPALALLGQTADLIIHGITL